MLKIVLFFNLKVQLFTYIYDNLIFIAEMSLILLQSAYSY